MLQQKPVKISARRQLFNWANAPYKNNSFLLQSLHAFIRIILITYKEFNNNDLNIRASALTYTILLSLVPLLAMGTAVVKGLGGGDELRQVAYSYIDAIEKTIPLTQIEIPGITPGLETTRAEDSITSMQEEVLTTDTFRSAADQIFNYVDKTDFATLGTIGVLGVLLSAILVLSNIELSMNTIWHVPAGRSLLRKLTDYLTLLILMPLSINFGFAANAVLKSEALLDKLIVRLPGPWVHTAILLLVPLFFIILTLFLIYIFFPNTKVKPVPALIGAVFAGTLWFLTQNIYIGLQIGVSKYNAIYGSFATLPLFLIWMFLGWVFILGGAQVAFACQQQQSYQLKRITHSPLEELSAAIDILNVIYNSYANKIKLTRKELPAHCPAYSATLLFSSLKQLISTQIVSVTRKGRLLPSSPANKLTYQEIVSSILGSSLPDTEGGKAASVLIKQVTPILEKNFSAEGKYE
ncbi:MAG: YihY/virulence factor BrkB family protein [Thermodesulfobacteriota bacterium]|nr:YihY/virulence factor BrkB family protein [Thermodesulfobacteriota bacterium]